MAIKMRFDVAKNPLLPTFVLATRSGRKIGALQNVTDVKISDNLNSPMDISFTIHKTDDDLLWDEVKNFRKVWVPDFDKWFTLSYSVSESSETIRNISLVPNSEFELSNTNVHALEINTESDIKREGYVRPTIFYDPENTDSSLLHRVLSFTKGFVIKYVDETLASIQRTFAIDGSNVYDALQEISKEIQCLFVFDSGTNEDGTIERAISAYDLRTYCNDCGFRGDFSISCPKCGSTNLVYPYGEDTTILVDTKALAQEIGLTTDTASVKNCFRLVSGDGMMDAAIINSNPNGSQYLWYFTESMMEDMSDALKTRIAAYNDDFEYYETEYAVPVPADLLSDYNTLVDKYSDWNTDLTEIDSITGYVELMNAMYDVMDFLIYLESGLLPALNFDTTAEQQAARITAQNMPEVAVKNVDIASETTVNNAVASAVKILLDARYNAKILNSTYSSVNHQWTGNFTVTARSDDEDTATSEVITVTITDNVEKFIRQKIEKAIAQGDKNSYSMAELFTLEGTAFANRLKMYSRDGLNSILDCCNAALGVMIELGVSNPETAIFIEGGINAYDEIYLPYYDRFTAIEEELALRDMEVQLINALYGELKTEKVNINDILSVDNYFGEQLVIELYSYKMEDDYQNSNYISTGLDNAELFKKAAEYVEVANEEIRLAATEHHSISTSLNNLLAIEEFKPLVDYFAVGNWIRVRVDKKLYRIQLLSYSIDYNDLSNIGVTFSDAIGEIGNTSIADVFNAAQSMAKSYDSVKHQASSGAESKATVDGWKDDGVDVTMIRLLNGDNKNLLIDGNGITLKEWDDIEGDYTDYQSRWINKTLAFTTDNWLTTETAIGQFEYYDPVDKQKKETYGVIANTIVGNIILGNKVGVYNENGSIALGEDGLVITANGDDSENMVELKIQKQYTDEQTHELVTVPQMYIDENGDLIYNGTVTFSSLDHATKEAMTVSTTSKNQYYLSNSDSQLVGGTWVDDPDDLSWQSGKYIWTKIVTTKTDANGNTSTTESDAVYDVMATNSEIAKHDIDNLSLGGTQLLPDTNAPSLNKVDADRERYWTNPNASYISHYTMEYITISEPPVQGINYGIRMSLDSSWDSIGRRGIGWRNNDSTVRLIAGETYTMSCYARLISGNIARIELAKMISSNSSLALRTTYDITNTSWKQYSATFKWEDGYTYMSQVFFTLVNTYAAGVEMCGFKLERGSKASDWSEFISHKDGSITNTVSCYYRKTVNPYDPDDEPTINPSTIIGTTDISDAWLYIMPSPVYGATFWTCERYEYKGGDIGFSTVRQLSNLSAVSAWCNANDATKIDGSHIFTGTLAAGSIAARVINVSDLMAFNATIGSWSIGTNEIYSEHNDGSTNYRVSLVNTAVGLSDVLVVRKDTGTIDPDTNEPVYEYPFVLRADGSTYVNDMFVRKAIRINYGVELYGDNQNSEPYIDFHRENVDHPDPDNPGQSLVPYDYTARISNSSPNHITILGEKLASSSTASACTVHADSFVADNTVTAQNYVTTSDRRLKKHITHLDLGDCEAFIKALIPSRFEYRHDYGKYHHGFIYDEIDSAKYDDEWQVSQMSNNLYGDGESYGAVSLQEIIPDMIKVMQGMLERLETLEKEKKDNG